MQYKPIAPLIDGRRSPCFLKIFIMTACTFIVVSIFCTLAVTVWGYPLHASCKAQWTFQENCFGVNQAIVSQIKQWTSKENCKNGGEKCLYTLNSVTDTQIVATHQTPVKHYVDDITFTFTDQDKMCILQGKSRSETWYAVLDYGTNYCNMHNLITGAGLDKKPGYKEDTSNSKCTQYSSANCEKY